VIAFSAGGVSIMGASLVRRGAGLSATMDSGRLTWSGAAVVGKTASAMPNAPSRLHYSQRVLLEDM
jgi:hypothetical protein